MESITGFIHQPLSATTDAARLKKWEAKVKELCRSYPLLFSEEWTGKTCLRSLPSLSFHNHFCANVRQHSPRPPRWASRPMSLRYPSFH